MKVELPKGKYVIAVSGGVDSIVLLDILAKRVGFELVVAHFDHGIRPDSAEDKELVKKTARQLGLPFETAKGKLGAKASEATARAARYAFLESIRQKHQAQAIITAHHQDDLLETALINLLRGTGWRGLSSIWHDKRLKRPLLKIGKTELLAYAQENDLKWREDSTNQDMDYLRNYVRNKLLPKLSSKDRQKLISKIDSVAKNKPEMNILIATISQSLLLNNSIDRQLYARLPRTVAKEIIGQQLRVAQTPEIDSHMLNSLDLAIRTSQPGRKYPIDRQTELLIKSEEATLLRI